MARTAAKKKPTKPAGKYSNPMRNQASWYCGSSAMFGFSTKNARTATIQMEFRTMTAAAPHQMEYEAALTFLADWMRWASTNQSKWVAIPKPPKNGTAIM